MLARQLTGIVKVLLPVVLAAVSSAEEYSHRVFRTEDGLPQNRIQAITQTQDRYLWVGTSEGLARFDGVRFVVFDRSNTPEFADYSILSLEAARDGSLWIGTEGGGLQHYAHGAFSTFGEREGLTNGFVRSIHADRSGSVWVGTDRGFFRFSDGRFARLDGTPDIPLASVLKMAEDPSGKLWVASSAGLLVVDQGRLIRAACPGRPAGNPVLAVSLLREGFASNGCDVPKIPVPDAVINSMRRDTSGNLWIGTLGRGLLKLERGAITSYKAPLFLPENTVFAIFQDRENNIWAGGLDGLVRLSQTAVTTVTARDGLADDNISATYEDRDRQLWAITFSGQIYRFHGNAPQRYYLPSAARDLRMRTIFEDSRGDYWFGTSGSGVIRQSGNKTTLFTKSQGLRSNTVRQILEGPPGTIWIATDSGISRWGGRAFTNYYLEDGLTYPSVRCLAIDTNGDILAGTDAGLNRIHDGRIIADPVLAGLRQEKIWSILVDEGGLWLGTRGGGLVRIKGNRTLRVTVRDGLASNSIYQVLDDQKGRLWMSSPAGVFSVARQEIEALASGSARAIHSVSFGTSDGMETSQMYGGLQPAGCRRSSGELWFPSVRGAVRIDPARLPRYELAPVFIERVAAGDTVFPLGQEVVIPPGYGKFQVDYTACNLLGPQRVDFTYKLEGFDQSWTSALKPRSAYYSNLPPGHYRFRVVAADTGATGATSEASISIYLKPAYYQTAWFYALCGAAFIGAVWAGLAGYTRQTKARFAVLLTERTRLAREMHDTVIQGCVGVSTLLEAAARSQRSNTAEASQLLDHARSQVKSTLEEARQAVWDLRHSLGDGSAVANLFDLARKLGAEHGAEVDTEIEGEKTPLDPATDRTLLLVGREALRNAMTHGNPSRVTVRIKFESAQVRMEVHDNGAGFDTDSLPLESEKHFGIVGMRERVEQIGGEFSMRSGPGEGTSVLATLPSGA